MMQFGLLILTLVSALIGTLAKTHDDSAKQWWRRVRPWGWAIALILLVSFAFSARETWQKVEESKKTDDENVKLRANVSSLMEQLGETRKQVTQSLDLLEGTEALLNQERSATVLGIFADWELVDRVYLQLEFFSKADEGASGWLEDPFWFVPGLVSYELRNRAHDMAARLEFTAQRRAKDETPEQAVAREDNEKKAGYEKYSPGPFVWHDYRIDGIDRLGMLLYDFRSGSSGLEIRLTFRNPPNAETIKIVRDYVTDRKKLDVKVLAPIEKNAFLAARRGWSGDWEKFPKGHPGVFWRVRIPLTVTEVVQVPEEEGGKPEQLVLRLAVQTLFVEQDYSLQPGP